MQLNVKQIRKHRYYSEDFRKQIVQIFESGKYSALQLAKLYGITTQSIYNWVYKYSAFNEKGFRVVEMKDSKLNKLKELEEKVKNLERLVGQKQIQIEYLEKMIDIAKSDLAIDIKKNYNTPPWNGSGSTKTK